MEATGSHPDSFLHGGQSQGAKGDASKITLDQGVMEPVFRKVLLLLGPPAEQMRKKSRGRQQTTGSSFSSTVLEDVALTCGILICEKGHRWGRAGGMWGGDVITQISPKHMLSRMPRGQGWSLLHLQLLLNTPDICPPRTNCVASAGHLTTLKAPG